MTYKLLSACIYLLSIISSFCCDEVMSWARQVRRMSPRPDPPFDCGGSVSHALGSSDMEMFPLGSCKGRQQDEKSNVTALVKGRAVSALRMLQDHKASLFTYCSAGILVFYFTCLQKVNIPPNS